ncbi:hypothetical protein HDU96_003295, partial [Phlyctochytrium bullatum]
MPAPLPAANISQETFAVVINAVAFDQACQTDPVIITTLPKSLIPRDHHCVAQICVKINNALHLEVLLDSGADINVITRAALRKLKSRYGRSIQVHPFPYEKKTEGIGGLMPVDGYCVLDISPGRNSTASKTMAFHVIKESPRPIILGMPTINAFHMDLCTSINELRFFWEETNRDGTTTVRYDTTPLKTVQEGFTFQCTTRGPPQVRVASSVIVPPHSAEYVRCYADAPPSRSEVYLFEASRKLRRSNTFFAATCYNHEDIYPDDVISGFGRKVFLTQVFNDSGAPLSLTDGQCVGTLTSDV